MAAFTLTTGSLSADEQRDQIREILVNLGPTSEKELGRIRHLIKQLDSDSYADRRAAQASLMGTTVPNGFLEKARENASVNLATIIDEIQLMQTDRSIENRLHAAMFSIVESKIPNLVAELVSVLEWRHYKEGNQWFLAIDAFRATATPECDAELQSALTSKDALVRAGALEGLRKIHGGSESLIPALLILKDEPHPLTAVELADELAEFSRIEALYIYARLLACDDVSVRSRSRDALRKITDENLNVSIFVGEEERNRSSKRWRTWLDENALTNIETMKFPGQDIPIREDAIPLFNGKDITNWLGNDFKVIDPFGVLDKNFAEKSKWQVNDSLLISGKDSPALSIPIEDRMFTLRIDWRFPDGSETPVQIGIFANSPNEKESGAFIDVIPGIAGNIGIWGDKLTMRDATGEKVEFRKVPDAKTNDRRRQWNTLEIEVRDAKIHTRINGRDSNTVEIDPLIDCGHHFIIKPGADPVEFRNVLLQKD